MHFKTLFLILLLSSLLGCSPEISDNIVERISNSDNDFAVITPKKALFIFKIAPKKSWEWNTEQISPNQIEYAWWTDFSLNDRKYSSGYFLYPSPYSKKSSGSLKQLIKSGQTNFSERGNVSKKKYDNDIIIVEESIDQKKDPKVETIVKYNAVIILLKEQEVIDQFREIRPDSLLFYRVKQPSKSLTNYKVAVNYTSP